MDAKAKLEQVKLALRERWADFRERSGFYQVKALLILVYAVVVVGTVILAVPKTEDFAMRVGRVPWGAGERTFVDLTNQDGGDREELAVEVSGTTVEFDGSKTPGVWTALIPRLVEGKTQRVWPEDLSDSGGRRPSSDFTVDRVRLRKGKKVFLELVNKDK